MDNFFQAPRFDLPLNLISGAIFIAILRLFYGEYISTDSIIKLFLIRGIEEKYIMVPVVFAGFYFAGYMLAVIYHIINRKIVDITIPSRVEYVLFGIGLDPKYKFLIGGRPLTKEQRYLFMQKARRRFPNLPRAHNKISDEQYTNLFYLAENAVKKDESVYKHIQQTETLFTIAGRLAVSIWAALSFATILLTIYAFFVASSPMIYTTIVEILHLLPLEFSVPFIEFVNYINVLDNSNVSIMMLSFKAGFLFFLSALLTSLLMSIFRFYCMEYDREIFLHVAYSDADPKTKKEHDVSEN